MNIKSKLEEYIILKKDKIKISSKEIKKNDIFLALKGKNYHGNKFINSSIKNGAKFCITDNKNYPQNEKVIFISSKLSTKFKVKKKIILHDAVDITNFKKPKYKKNLKNVGYLGSFYKGRGIELIIEVAKKNLNLNFYLIGKDKNFIFDKKLTSNIKVLDHVPYLIQQLLEQH